MAGPPTDEAVAGSQPGWEASGEVAVHPGKKPYFIDLMDRTEAVRKA